jgi:hypothetical protein
VYVIGCEGMVYGIDPGLLVRDSRRSMRKHALFIFMLGMQMKIGPAM